MTVFRGSQMPVKGDVIDCPWCKAPIMECIKTPTTGDVLGPENLRPIGFVMEPGDPCVCPHCGFAWMVHK